MFDPKLEITVLEKKIIQFVPNSDKLYIYRTL